MFDLQLLSFSYLVGYERVTRKNIHQRNTESLAIETYKFQAVLTPLIMNDLFVTSEFKNNLTNVQTLDSSHKQTVEFGIKTFF